MRRVGRALLISAMCRRLGAQAFVQGAVGLLVGKLAHRPRNFLLLVLRLSLSHLTLLSLHFKLTSPSYCNQLTFSLSFTLMKCTCVVSKIFASSVK